MARVLSAIPGAGEAVDSEVPPLFMERAYAERADLKVYSLSRPRSVRPSDEKSTSFCRMLRRTRSALRPHAAAVVAGGSQPVPVRNLRSAFWMVVRSVFSALGERRPVWISRMPNSLGPCCVAIEQVDEVAVTILPGVWGVMGVRGKENGLAGVEGIAQRRGLAWGSDNGGGNIGEATEEPGMLSDAEDDVLDVELPVPLRTNCFSPTTGEAKRVGDAMPGVIGGEFGVGGTMLGSWNSFRTTTNVICKAFLASLLDVYSNASVK